MRPYIYDFKCHVKRRWEGKTLVDLFAEEFPLLTREYYLRAVAAQRLRIDSVQGGVLSRCVHTHMGHTCCARWITHTCTDYL